VLSCCEQPKKYFLRNGWEKNIVPVKVQFQTCDDKRCLPPEQMVFNLSQPPWVLLNPINLVFMIQRVMYGSGVALHTIAAITDKNKNVRLNRKAQLITEYILFLFPRSHASAVKYSPFVALR
jgi:hypothetical protein